MQSILITPDSVGVKEYIIISGSNNKNKNNNNDSKDDEKKKKKNNKKKQVHFSPTLDWSIEDTKIHRRKDWKKKCRIKKKKSSTTGKRTHVIMSNPPPPSSSSSSSSLINKYGVPFKFCPPRFQVVYTMLANGSPYFLDELLQSATTNNEIRRDLFDVCKTVTCNNDVEYLDLEELFHELKATFPRNRFQRDQIFALEYLYFGFQLKYPREVQEATAKLYSVHKEELAKTGDAYGSVDEKSTVSGNTESSDDLSNLSELDSETAKGFHHLTFTRGIVCCDGTEDVYGSDYTSTNLLTTTHQCLLSPLVLLLVLTLLLVITTDELLLIGLQRIFLIRTKRELDSTRTGSPLQLLKDVHLMQVPFQTTVKMIVPKETNKIVFKRQRIENQSSKATLRLHKNNLFLSMSK